MPAAQEDVRQMTQPFSQILDLAPNALSDIADFLQNTRSEATVRTGRNNAAVFSFKDDNFISRSLVPDKEVAYHATNEYLAGKREYGDSLLTVDYSKLKDSIAPKLFHAKPSLATPFIDELQANRITFSAFETKTETGSPQTYILVGKEDYSAAEKIMSDLNHYRYFAQELPHTDLYESGKDKDFAKLEKIDDLTFNQLKKDHLLCFPHAVTSYLRGTRKLYDITCREEDRPRLEKAVRQTSIYLSGRTREILTDLKKQHTERLEEAYRQLADNGKSKIVIDEAHPDRYVKSCGESVTIYRIGKDGREEPFGTIRKDDSSWYVRLNKELRTYASPRVLNGDIDIRKELEKAYTERAVSRKSPDEQMLGFKHEIAHRVCEMMEHEWYKDNIIRFGNAKDHAVIIKDDNAARDLEGDIALNNRAAGGTKGVVDYSDIGDSYSDVPRETQRQEYMETLFRDVLGTGHYAKEEQETIEKELSEDPVFKHLSHAREEVQELLKEDLLESIKDIAATEFVIPLLKEDFEQEILNTPDHVKILEEENLEFDL